LLDGTNDHSERPWQLRVRLWCSRSFRGIVRLDPFSFVFDGAGEGVVPSEVGRLGRQATVDGERVR
jgi:hypothetical protein